MGRDIRVELTMLWVELWVELVCRYYAIGGACAAVGGLELMQ